MLNQQLDKILQKVPGRTQSVLYWLVLLILAGAGVAIILYSTPWGSGLRNDSFAYVAGARNIAAGYGYGRPNGSGTIIPVTHFPPMFSIVLAIPQLLGIDAVITSRFTIAILYGLLVLLAGLIVHKATGSRIFALLAGALVLMSAVLVDVYSWLMSEPLYMLLAFMALLFLAIYIDNRKWRYLILSAVLAELAYLTRYVGSTLLITAGLVLLINNVPWKQKIKELLVYAASSLPLIIAWMARNYILTGSATNRSVNWHPVTLENLQEGVNNIIYWFIPGRLVNGRETLTAVLVGVLLVALLVIGLLRIKAVVSKEKGYKPGTVFILALHSIVYLAMLVVSISLIEGSTVLDNRLLSPVYLCWLLLGVIGLYTLWQYNRLVLHLAVAGFCILYLGYFASRVTTVVKSLSSDGQGFASERWREAEIVEAIQVLPDVTIYTDSPTAVYLLTGRTAYIAPFRVDPSTGLEREDYTEWLTDMHRRMRDKGAVLVIFNVDGVLSGSSEDVWMADLTKGLKLDLNLSDGRVYRYQP